MKHYKKTKRFTLIELLVAMAVLVILALVLFEILNRGRQAWSAMEANTRIYENARVVLDVISRDLQCSANDEDLPFETDADGMPTFFSIADRMRDAHARITEISYTVDENQFRRRLVQDHHTSATGTGFQRVIDGIEEMIFVYYNRDGDELDFNQTYDEPPAVVWLSITLFDPRAVNLEGAAQDRMIERSRRTFNKMIYLKAQRQ